MAHARPRPKARNAGLVLVAAAAAAGCQSTGGTDPLSRWRMTRDQGIAKTVTAEEVGDDKRGPIARLWSPGRSSAGRDPGKFNASALVGGSNGYSPLAAPKDAAADAEFAAVEQKFRQGNLAEAEAEFAAISKKRKGTPWGEKAAYFLGETRYQRGNYVGAHDAFEVLITDYPGTSYLEKAVAREYAIGNDWLAQGDPKAMAAAAAKAPVPWNARVVGRLPLVDVHGHALQALEHVRHHDPTGPLADDAVMKVADYHFGSGNYEDAAFYYDQLLTDHPKSEFYRRAQMASIDSKMKGYLGPEYDGNGLDQARESIKQALAAEGDGPGAADKALYNNLALINEQQAERAYKDGEFYRRTGYVKAAEYSFAEIPARWPRSPWAKKAKVQLAELAKMPRKEVRPSKIMAQPGSPDPYSGGITPGAAPGTAGGTGGGMGAPIGGN